MIQQFYIGYLSKGNKNTNLKRYLQPHVHSIIIHYSLIAKIQKQVSIDG